MLIGYYFDCRPRGSPVGEGELQEGVHQALELQKQVLQGGPRGDLPQAAGGQGAEGEGKVAGGERLLRRCESHRRHYVAILTDFLMYGEVAESKAKANKATARERTCSKTLRIVRKTATGGRGISSRGSGPWSSS